MQLVLCNYTNLQLHVSHATEFQLQTTVAKPKISSSAIQTTLQSLIDPSISFPICDSIDPAALIKGASSKVCHLLTMPC